MLIWTHSPNNSITADHCNTKTLYEQTQPTHGININKQTNDFGQTDKFKCLQYYDDIEEKTLKQSKHPHCSLFLLSKIGLMFVKCLTVFHPHATHSCCYGKGERMEKG